MGAALLEAGAVSGNKWGDSAKPKLRSLRREHQFPHDCTDKSFVEHGMSWTKSIHSSAVMCARHGIEGKEEGCLFVALGFDQAWARTSTSLLILVRMSQTEKSRHIRKHTQISNKAVLAFALDKGSIYLWPEERTRALGNKFGSACFRVEDDWANPWTRGKQKGSMVECPGGIKATSYEQGSQFPKSLSRRCGSPPCS